MIINPNSSAEMTKIIDTVARQYAALGTEITTVSLLDAPDFIASAHDAEVIAPEVAALVEKNRRKYDYFIIACGYDPGLDACRALARNVIGVGEAAILTACAVAKRFSFLSSTEGSAAAVPDKLRSLGIGADRLASARPLGGKGDIVQRRHELFDVYCEVGQRCIDEDGAGALILSCAGMSDLKGKLERCLKVPVIAGVISALKIAEQFAGVPYP